MLNLHGNQIPAGGLGWGAHLRRDFLEMPLRSTVHARRFGQVFALLIFLAPFVPALEPTADVPDLGSRAAVLMDAATGTVVYAKNGDAPIPPASLAKLMTIHIALQEVEAGRASLDEIVELPPESWANNQPPRSSLMHLAAGHIVSLRELILGMAIPSGNDAAVAVALRFYPSVEEFVGRMNREARNLGLAQTRFVEPSGISEENMTTALEFAEFCRVYISRHPESLRDFHSVMEFAYPRADNVAPAYRSTVGTWRQRNHNTLLTRFEGADGLKTGYIDEAGYNIALTAARLETRLIAVVLGAPASYGGDRIRDADGTKLLTWGFSHFKTIRPPEPELPLPRIWKGKLKQVELIPGEPLVFTSFTDRGEGLLWETVLEDPLIAPLSRGSEVGFLILYDEAGELRRIPLVTATDIEQGNIFKRAWDSVGLFFRGLFKPKKK
ncbi:serine-type D-Ala-D-Ala carboxypeptidase DacC [Treponema primitia ZAS-2]|uniref:serine-type D-Ala-D-Ala carboxypeptidase n=1 Tax=Treponema primitia (strain ATCC BAA-887 / DSM 12427 / ZAS-2) TaxID=545694 RepID=F5YII9_TREPZ|nr:D-alanyl-D-alanine carboxypeptidase family protein [Treponema primitia]AEF86605.1 serine-type D-Ala-D-Ala carboxypeptidase DacC [Treponema primitia ZAS-2]